MRVLAWIPSLVVLVMWSCGGDSSAILSTRSDGSIAPAAGGQGGAVGGQGGQAGASSQGSVAVRGGARDLATTQCTEASGTACAVPAENLRCLDENCAENLVDCYYSDGVSTAAGGRCQGLANCILACPCDSDAKKCQDGCVTKHAPLNSDCGNCLYGLAICVNSSGCPAMWACVVSSI
jgi:hypothetical protein